MINVNISIMDLSSNIIIGRIFHMENQNNGKAVASYSLSDKTCKIALIYSEVSKRMNNETKEEIRITEVFYIVKGKIYISVDDESELLKSGDVAIIKNSDKLNIKLENNDTFNSHIIRTKVYY